MTHEMPIRRQGAKITPCIPEQTPNNAALSFIHQINPKRMPDIHQELVLSHVHDRVNMKAVIRHALILPLALKRQMRRRYRDMLERAPSVQYLVRSRVYLVKERIEDPAVLGAAFGGQIRLHGIVRGHEDGIVVGDVRLMQIQLAVVLDIIWRREPELRAYRQDLGVRRVEEGDAAVAVADVAACGAQTAPVVHHRFSLEGRYS